MVEYDTRFAIVRSPDDNGPVVARFDGGDGGTVTIPDEIATHDGFVIQTLDSRSAFESKGADNDTRTDQAGLTDEEIERLMSGGYPDTR